MNKLDFTFSKMKMLGMGAVLALGLPLAANAQYCTTGLYSSGCTFGDELTSFTLGTGGSLINSVSTGCPSGSAGYSDYTSINATVQPGDIIPFTVTSDYGCCQGFAIWIDFNDNFVFEASEKLYGNTSTSGSESGTITIPVTAPGGPHRMRVRDVWNTVGTSIDPCNSYSFGEVHDYTITVNAAPCAAPLNPGIASSSQPSYCQTQPISLTVTGASFGMGMLYQWQSSASGLPGTWVNIAGATGPGYSAPQAA